MREFGVKGLTVLLGALLILGWCQPVLADDNSADRGKVYLIMVDKMSVYDVSQEITPTLGRLVKEGAVGLVSNRTLRGKQTADVSLTIGAGNLARAYDNGIMGFNVDENVTDRNQPAGKLFYELTGTKADEAAAVMVNLPEITGNMALEKVNTVPGAMAENLRAHNYRVAVLGNGDVAKDRMRAAVAVGMDAAGRVFLGDVGPAASRPSADSHLSLETNYPYLEQKVKEYARQADVIIIDLSDLARLETADMPTAARAEVLRQGRLQKIDRFVANIVEQMDAQKDMLLLTSVSPSLKQTLLKDTFGMVVIYGKGYHNAFLSSGATRRDYIVANTDIAPTVLNFFGLSDATRTMIGQPMVAKPAGDADTLQQARHIDDQASIVNRIRVPLNKGYVVLQIILILLGLLTIFAQKRMSQVVQRLLVLLVTVPLVLLVLGRLTLPCDWLYMVVAVAASVLLNILVVRACRGDAYQAFIITGICTIVLLDIDLFTGTTMIQSSVLGYDPMAGARYYGIGNEYMGILLGSVIAVAATIYHRYRRRWLLAAIGAFFLLQCYLIAGPMLGANSDGILTVPAAFLVTIFLLADIRIKPRYVLLMGLIILIGILGITWYDMHRPVEMQSHIGRAANLMAAGGWQEGLTIISRKLAMNLKLIRYTIWSWVFIVILLVLSILVYRPVGLMKQLMQRYPYIVKGFAGTITGALVGLVVNDSGIVAAATTSIYLVVPILILMLHLKCIGSPAEGGDKWHIIDDV